MPFPRLEISHRWRYARLDGRRPEATGRVGADQRNATSFGRRAPAARNAFRSRYRAFRPRVQLVSQPASVSYRSKGRLEPGPAGVQSRGNANLTANGDRLLIIPIARRGIAVSVDKSKLRRESRKPCDDRGKIERIGDFSILT